jgi:hypothetical protein
MQLLPNVSLEELTPARLWSELDAETRAAAARCLYARPRDDGHSRDRADLAIAAALRFREVAVRRLPVERRVAYLTRAVRPDDSLAYALLMALHLESRQELLQTFLDELGIPQQHGLIDETHELKAPGPERLAQAVDKLYASFPAEQVTLYLTSLVAMDRTTWNGLAPQIRRP